MKKTSLAVIGILLALAVTGCCKSKKSGSSSSSEPVDTASTVEPETTGGGAAVAGGPTLTGADGVKKLKAKGWKAVSEPTTNDVGTVKSTAFVSTPDYIVITFSEYKDQAMATMTHSAMANAANMNSAIFGRTVVLVPCPAGKDKAKCQKAIDDLK